MPISSACKKMRLKFKLLIRREDSASHIFEGEQNLKCLPLENIFVLVSDICKIKV